MPSNRILRRLGAVSSDQRGIGLVEMLVASALLGVAIVVMLGSLSTLVVGSRTADRRTAEERLVRNEVEQLMAAPVKNCDGSTASVAVPVDASTYTVSTTCSTPLPSNSHYVEYMVTATDTSGAKYQLQSGRFVP